MLLWEGAVDQEYSTVLLEGWLTESYCGPHLVGAHYLMSANPFAVVFHNYHIIWHRE